jgi:hypothetical protein
MTTVTVGLQYTRNLGNFENARVHFEISDDLRQGESIDAAKDRIFSKVESWVEQAVSSVDAEAAARKGQ